MKELKEFLIKHRLKLAYTALALIMVLSLIYLGKYYSGGADNNSSTGVSQAGTSQETALADEGAGTDNSGSGALNSDGGETGNSASVSGNSTSVTGNDSSNPGGKDDGNGGSDSSSESENSATESGNDSSGNGSSSGSGNSSSNGSGNGGGDAGSASGGNGGGEAGSSSGGNDSSGNGTGNDSSGSGNSASGSGNSSANGTGGSSTGGNGSGNSGSGESTTPETPAPEEYTCSFKISCVTIFDNLDKASEGTKRILPDDGIFFDSTLTFTYGENVAKILKRICTDNDIALDISSNSYVRGIGNIYELDLGRESGWMYCVNGAYPAVGCGSYYPKDGDVIEFNYTCVRGDLNDGMLTTPD